MHLCVAHDSGSECRLSSLNNIKHFVFVKGADRILCDVPTKCYILFKQNSCLKALVVTRRPLTAETLVRSQVSPCDIFRGQIGTGSRFSRSTSLLPLSASFHHSSSLTCCSYQKDKRSKCWETSNKAKFFHKSEALNRKIFSLLMFVQVRR